MLACLANELTGTLDGPSVALALLGTLRRSSEPTKTSVSPARKVVLIKHLFSGRQFKIDVTLLVLPDSNEPPCY
jgi:hypothetical protein